MGNSQADLRPGANVIAPNGQQYVVTDVTDSEKRVRTRICTIENEKGQKMSVPADLLSPAGQSPAKIAIMIFGKTFTIGDTATFMTADNIYKNATIQDINSKAILLRNEDGSNAVSICDIKGISLVY